MEERKKARLELRIALLKRGLSLRALARRLGYNPDVFIKIISRWWGRNSLPRGEVSRKIILDIQRFLHDNPPLVFPEHNSQDPENEDKKHAPDWGDDSKKIKGAGL